MYSTFWGDGAGVSGSYAPIQNKSPIRGRSRQLVNREQYRVLTALFNGLIGAVSGANVTATHARVSPRNNTLDTPSDNVVGGLRRIDTVTDINRNTTAADVTALKEITFAVNRRPSPYVPDLSGNGGRAF
jgi:hypothetical protein